MGRAAGVDIIVVKGRRRAPVLIYKKRFL